MRKILLKQKYPELAKQVVDVALLDTLGVSDKRKIRWRCGRGHEWDAIVLNRTRKGYGCPYCSGRLAIPGETDLATMRPDLAAELVNENLASQLKATSHVKVEWRCSKGHVYEASPAARTSKGSACPYCSGRSAYVGETDIGTTHPELARELVDETLAATIKAGTNKKVEWQCFDCGYRWWASPNSRTSMGSGCPRCHGKVLTDDNALSMLKPDVATEIVDNDLLNGSFVRKITLKCEKGHTWEVLATNYAQFGQNCPICESSAD